jgi:hypothetical protein
MKRTVLLLLLCVVLGAQERLRPLDASTAKTIYSFPVAKGRAPFRFQVELDPTGMVTGASVFREGESTRFQFLPACQDRISDVFTEYDSELDLIEHADLNFDGFEDVELLQFFHPHLGSRVYCIYTWDDKSGTFHPAPEIPALHPTPHPESKTITVHQDWMGGVYADRTYRWTGAKFELIEESGRGHGSDDPKCLFTDTCSKLINGKMVTTLSRPAACEDDRPEPDLVCPAGPAPKARPTKK